jgi:exopolyphosphatase/guanosine-5'-triphosphate,3'-diphosphate pyrophosphatase
MLALRSSFMPEIVPRWEWRSFGRSLGDAESRLAELRPGGVQESDEIYLLSGIGDNVKVRDDLMDVKVLREVNPDGLEQWTPVMKAGFPLPAGEAAKVFAAVHAHALRLSSGSYTLEQLIGELAAPGRGVRVVKVHKRRVRYTVGGCMAELSDVVANGKATRTIAVEAEDAAAVIRAVRELGQGAACIL